VSCLTVRVGMVKMALKPIRKPSVEEQTMVTYSGSSIVCRESKFLSLFRHFTLVLIVFYCSPALSGDTDNETSKRHLHINGLSYHFKSSDKDNAYTWGAGITLDRGYLDERFGWLKGVMFGWEADVFKDSNREIAYAAGFSVRKSFLSWYEWGVTMGLTHKKNLERDTGWPIFPYALPFLQTAFEAPVNLRLVWIPPVRKSTDNQLILQVLIAF